MASGHFITKSGNERLKKIHMMQVESFKNMLNKYKDYDTSPAAESIDAFEQKMERAYGSCC